MFYKEIYKEKTFKFVNERKEVSVVVVISESASPQFFGELIVFRHLNMDFTIILEYTFSQFQDKNISLTVRKKNILTNIDAYCFERALQ